MVINTQLIGILCGSSIGSIIFLHQFIAWFGRASASGVREYLPVAHVKKGATPSMGGIVWVLGCVIWYLIAGRAYAIVQHPEVICSVLLVVAFGLTGLFDDIAKKVYKKGISARLKSSLQLIGVCSVVALYLYYTYVQSVANNAPDALFFSPILRTLFSSSIHITSYLLVAICAQCMWMIFVIVGASNAVNLTDGLDGLAGGIALIISIFLLAIAHAYASPLEGLLVVLIGCLIGFLFFNRHPARIFMGDVGSLSLGALMGFVFLVFKSEWFFVLAGILYVINTLAVILQVSWYKKYKKRIFPMTPLHHSFELAGYREATIVGGAWVITLVATLTAALLFFYV
jgi:phospho-N-acetylmuramoyl-pentapeptide-transferase